MKAALPKNPFSTRYTRPEAVAFLCLPGSQVDDCGTGLSQSHRLAAGAVCKAASEGTSSADNESAETAKLCCRIVGRLKTERFGLIVGPHGSGKTTLLYALMPFIVSAFEGDGPERVRRMQLTMPLCAGKLSRFKHARKSLKAAFDCLRGLSPGSLLVIDGIEQLSIGGLKSLLRALRRQGVLFLATSHSGLAGLSILHRTAVDVMLIQSLADRLLENATPAVVEIVSRELQCRDLNACTNVRDLWFELYDIVQDELLVDSIKLKDASDGGSIVSSHDSQHASDSHR